MDQFLPARKTEGKTLDKGEKKHCDNVICLSLVFILVIRMPQLVVLLKLRQMKAFALTSANHVKQ